MAYYDSYHTKKYNWKNVKDKDRSIIRDKDKMMER